MHRTVPVPIRRWESRRSADPKYVASEGLLLTGSAGKSVMRRVMSWQAQNGAFDELLCRIFGLSGPVRVIGPNFCQNGKAFPPKSLPVRLRPVHQAGGTPPRRLA